MLSPFASLISHTGRLRASIRNVLATSILISLAVHASAAPAETVLRRWAFDDPTERGDWRAGEDVADLRIEYGQLRLTLTGPNAYLHTTPLNLPMDDCRVRVRLRGPAHRATETPWVTEVRWITDAAESYDPHRRQRARLLAPPRQDAPDEPTWFTAEFTIDNNDSHGRRLRGLRLHPYPGLEAGQVAIDSIEIAQTTPHVEAFAAFESHQVSVDEPVRLRAGWTHHGTSQPAGPGQVTFPSAKTITRTSPRGRTTEFFHRTHFADPGVHRVITRITPSPSVPTQDIESSIIVGQGPNLPTEAGLRAGPHRLDLVPTSQGEQFGAMRWQYAIRDGEWRELGWLMPLASLTCLSDDDKIMQREPAMQVTSRGDGVLILAGAVDQGGRWIVEVVVRTIEIEGRIAVEVATTLTPPQDGRLLDFSGPVLRMVHSGDRISSLPGSPLPGPTDRFALFGGLEFLGPGRPSSSARAVGRLAAPRWSPDPFKITVPIMGIEADGVTRGMFWHPNETWDTEHALPTAVFASPNFLDHQPNHLARLAVPTLPAWRQENQRRARTPYGCNADQPLVLSHLLYATHELPIAALPAAWYAIYGVPAPPPPPHSNEATYDLLAEHHGQTMYWPEEQGWRTHWYLKSECTHQPENAAMLIEHALTTGEREWIEATSLSAGASIIETLGTLDQQLGDEINAKASLTSMRPDGTWPFRNTEQMREKTRQFTQGRYDTLGEDGSTSLGHCVQHALPLLRRARLTGQPDYVQPSIRALEAMMQFRVPRGAQTWEVHQDIPDIRAAALAVEAYHIGYQLTNDPRYLNEAIYWAWAGASFLYSWQVPTDPAQGGVLATPDRDEGTPNRLPRARLFIDPRRQVTPYGTIPVLGPSYYEAVIWFGKVVQWCGLEWALKVIELDNDHPVPVLRYIADGVVLSGRQQMFDRAPWTGLYPDVWDLRKNLACGAFITAYLPWRCMQAQGRLPRWTRQWSRVLHDQSNQLRYHVSGFGQPVALDPPHATRWSAQVHYLPGQMNELLIANVAAPRHVRVEDEALPERSTAPPAKLQPGWTYRAEHRALLVRFKQIAPHTRITVGW